MHLPVRPRALKPTPTICDDTPATAERDQTEQTFVDTAFSVFINGIGGVFTGIAVLYVMMKILSVVAGRSTLDSPSSAPKTD